MTEKTIVHVVPVQRPALVRAMDGAPRSSRHGGQVHQWRQKPTYRSGSAMKMSVAGMLRRVCELAKGAGWARSVLPNRLDRKPLA